MWVGRDKKLTSRTQMQQLHIPCLASMMQNKCFLSLQTLKTTTNNLIAPRVSFSKVFEFWVFWFTLCSVLWLKCVFVTTETEVGYGGWRKDTSGGLSDTFQTMCRQSDFRSNHRMIICNYPQKKLFKTRGYINFPLEDVIADGKLKC